MSIKVTVIISADGESATVDVKGFKGPGCAELTRKLQEALGETTKDLRTQEFYEKPVEVKLNAKA